MSLYTRKHYRLALAQLRMQPWGLSKVATAIESALQAVNDFPARNYTWPRHALTIRPARTLIMGIVNITPDSFSDGKYNDLDKALRHAEQLIADGADILNIGAESTRPYGAAKISAEIEMNRLLPSLEKISGFFVGSGLG